MGYTRNKRRANNFRKSRQLQIKKKATRRQYKGGAKQTKKRGQKGGAPGLAADVKAGIMDQARKNVAMKLMIEQADKSLPPGKSLTPAQLAIIDTIFPQNEDGTGGVEEEYLDNMVKKTKELRGEVFDGKKGKSYYFFGKDTRTVKSVDAKAAAAAAKTKAEAADADKKLEDAQAAQAKLEREGGSQPEKDAAAKVVEEARQAQKEAEKNVESKKNTQILSNKVFEIFKNGGSISFQNIATLTKWETSDEEAKKDVDLKNPKTCTLTVEKGEKGEKITFSYVDNNKFKPDKNYDFVKSVDNVKYDANSITLRVQRGSRFSKQPEKRTLVMTYDNNTVFDFKSNPADPDVTDRGTAIAVAKNNKILLNKVLSAYLINLSDLNKDDVSAFSADTIEQTAAFAFVAAGGGGGEGAPPADAGGGVRAGAAGGV